MSDRYNSAVTRAYATFDRSAKKVFICRETIPLRLLAPGLMSVRRVHYRFSYWRPLHTHPDDQIDPATCDAREKGINSNYCFTSGSRSLMLTRKFCKTVKRLFLCINNIQAYSNEDERFFSVNIWKE